MPLQRRPLPTDQLARLPLSAARPTWLTAGALRLGLLCLFIVAVGMVRPRLDREAAGWVVLAGGVAALVGVLFFLGATRRLAGRLPMAARSERAAHAVFIHFRRTGLPLLGLAFFLVWTFVYVGLWWVHPEEAFRGLGPDPRFADFFYYAVSTALISPPGDIVAASRGARSATMIEMITGFALLAAYLSSFVDWQRRRDAESAREPPGPS